MRFAVLALFVAARQLRRALAARAQRLANKQGRSSMRRYVGWSVTYTRIGRWQRTTPQNRAAACAGNT
jgi:hypothetical protein